MTKAYKPKQEYSCYLHTVINKATNMSRNENKKKSNIILNPEQNLFSNQSACFLPLSDYIKF